MPVPAPLTIVAAGRRIEWNIVAVIALFQSHWLDDLGTGSQDVAGLTVSAIGSVAIAAGAFGRGRRGGRALLAAGLVFVLFISLADLAGLQPDGAFAPDLMGHWRDQLGPLLTVAVAATLALALFSLQRLIRPVVSGV